MAKHVDAIVIGSGAGGGVMAKELSTAGMEVVVLERGRWVTSAECRKDDLRNQRTSVHGASFGPDDA
ncbi:MAG: NAD(P)-binding protein, partial [bacterium]|nr:NAD(P)-binding protein [bacterium]